MLSARQGFGTYLHFVKGMLTPESARERARLRKRLVELQSRELAGVYVETMVSPSMRSALAQTLQAPGVSGLENNTVLFELEKDEASEHVSAVGRDVLFAADVGKNVLVLRHGPRGFGRKRSIHLWLTNGDDRHAPLMVLLSYILLGHRAWRRATVFVFAALPSEEVKSQRKRFLTMIAEGRLPISHKNIQFIPIDSREAFQSAVEERSAQADLVIRGVSDQALRESATEALLRHQNLSTILLVCAAERVTIE